MPAEAAMEAPDEEPPPPPMLAGLKRAVSSAFGAVSIAMTC